MLKKVEACIQKIESCNDPVLRETSRELVQALLDFHGKGLAKLMALTVDSGNKRVLDEMARDELISQMLLLHGIHPEDTQTRIHRALDKVRPYLTAHGGNVDVLEIANGTVKLRLQGSCNGCPSSGLTLKNRIEDAILEAAPDTLIEVVA